MHIKRPISLSVRDVWHKKLKTEGHAKPLSHVWADLPDRLGSHSLPLVFAGVTTAKAGTTPASLSAPCFNALPSKKPDPKSSGVNGQAHADVSEVPG